MHFSRATVDQFLVIVYTTTKPECVDSTVALQELGVVMTVTFEPIPNTDTDDTSIKHKVVTVEDRKTAEYFLDPTKWESMSKETELQITSIRSLSPTERTYYFDTWLPRLMGPEKKKEKRREMKANRKLSPPLIDRAAKTEEASKHDVKATTKMVEEAQARVALKPRRAPSGHSLTKKRQDVLLQRVKDVVVIAMGTAKPGTNTLNSSIDTSDCNEIEAEFVESTFMSLINAYQEEFGDIKSAAITAVGGGGCGGGGGNDE